VVERKIGDGGGVRRMWRRGGMPLPELGTGNAKPAPKYGYHKSSRNASPVEKAREML
jgi:hypothetical protein